MEKPWRTGGTASLVPSCTATDASCAMAAMRGRRASIESDTSTSCVGLVSSGFSSKA